MTALHREANFLISFYTKSRQGARNFPLKRFDNIFRARVLDLTIDAAQAAADTKFLVYLDVGHR
jgi:hypothetical protein